MDRRTAKARRDRKMRRDAEVEKINSIYTLEVLEDNGKETED